MNKNTPRGFTEKEWEKFKSQYEKDYKMYNKHVKSFPEMINEILCGETETSFSTKTGLSPNMFCRITKYVNRNDPPQRSTLMSVAIGYNLDYQLTAKLFDSLGIGFILSNSRDYAYQYLLTNCRGKSVDECNEILHSLGIEDKYLLGSHARQNRTK